MKKLMPILLMSALLFGCAPQSGFIDDYVIPTLEDLTLEVSDYVTGDDTGHIYGGGTFVIVDGDMINAAYITQDYGLLVSVYLEEVSFSSFTLWSFDFVYMDFKTEETCYWEFYHYDELFVEDYQAERITMNYLDFAEELGKFNDGDIQYLVVRLKELG